MGSLNFVAADIRPGVILFQQSQGNETLQCRGKYRFHDITHVLTFHQHAIASLNAFAFFLCDHADEFITGILLGELCHRVLANKIIFVVLHRPLHLQLNRIHRLTFPQAGIPAWIFEAYDFLIIQAAGLHQVFLADG